MRPEDRRSAYEIAERMIADRGTLQAAKDVLRWYSSNQRHDDATAARAAHVADIVWRSLDADRRDDIPDAETLDDRYELRMESELKRWIKQHGGDRFVRRVMRAQKASHDRQSRAIEYIKASSTTR